MKDNFEKIYLDECVKLFDEPDKKELKKEIDKAQKLKDQTKFVKKFIKNYANTIINADIAKQMVRDIFEALFKERKDFSTLMKIYMLTINVDYAKTLKNVFILKDINCKKVENDEPQSNYIKFSINLSCEYENDSFYHKFIKGIFEYLQLSFDKNYLYQYVQMKYFQPFNEPKFYFQNISDIEYSLNKMLLDMKRVISSHASKMLSSNQNANKNVDNDKKKMKKEKYGIFLIKSQLYKDKGIYDIYDLCNSNDEIINKLDYQFLKTENQNILVLKDYIQEYIKNDDRDKEMKIVKEKLALKDCEVYSLTKEIDEFKSKDKEKEKEISGLKDKIIELNKKDINNQKEISELKKKVAFMEPIIISLICRKIINYSLRKILDIYKKDISITYNNNNIKPVYTIAFINPVNKISITELNNLLDYLFDKKSLYNNDSHLQDKDLPSFIPDLWILAKKSLNFDKNKLLAFDAIITDDIKSGFNFGDEDISVTDYLKTLDLSEFGQ